MRVSLKTSFTAFVLSSALAGAAVPALADSYYPGIDTNNPPGTQRQGQPLLPRLTSPPNVDVMPTGSIDGQRVSPEGSYQERYNSGEGEYYRGIVPPTP
jgi:hypothetical protein